MNRTHYGMHAYMMAQLDRRNAHERTQRRMGTAGIHTMIAAATLLLMLSTTACEQILPQRADMTLPDSTTIHSFYARHGLEAEYRYSGNVLEVVVQQPADQLRRGGALWARVGPYIYLFTPATRDLLQAHQGIAGVRAITMVGDTEVARALLVRDTLNELTWRRAVAMLGTALEQGTERPATMDALARFGEDHTTYEYNANYVRRR